MSPNSGGRITAMQSWSDIVRWTGRTVAGVPCALSVATTIASAGAGWPLAAWTCGTFILTLAGDITANDFEVHNGFTEFTEIFGAASLSQSCSTAQANSCITGIASRAFSEWADRLEEIENNNDIPVIEAVLKTGYGDVQVTLIWDNEADVDLHVIDPYGEEIYWNHDYSASNGVLDVDDTNGYGPENIYWPQGEAPEGVYEVYVHHYPWSSKPESANYVVLINAYGRIQKFSGHVAYDEVIHIYSFSQNGIESGRIRSSGEITLAKK